jgi:hypothetical protein
MAIPIQNIKKFLFYPLMCARVCRLWVAKFDGQHDSFNCVLLIIRLGFPCYHQSINNLFLKKKTKFYMILFLIAFMSSSLHISLVIVLFF